MWQESDEPAEQGQADSGGLLGPSLLRSAAVGLAVAAVLMAVLAPLAWCLPLLALNWLLRTAIAFAVAWVLFGVVHRVAGMVGWPFSMLAGALAVLVLVSNHVIFAIHGVPSRHGLISGAEWLTAEALLVANIPTLAGVCGCIWLRHDGSADQLTLIDILLFRIR